MKKTLLSIILFIFLCSCSSTPTINSNSATPPENKPTAISTSTYTPSPTIPPSPTPTPVKNITCSDPDSIKEIVDTFLKTNGYDSYSSFLDTLPTFSEACENGGQYCDNSVTIPYLNQWYQNANMRVVLLGSFEAKYASQAIWGVGQTCLLFANKDIPFPIPVLGAVQMEKYYSVATSSLGGFYTQAMTKERFDEWIKLHEGKFVTLGIVLYFFKESASKRPFENSWWRPNVLVNIVEDANSYPSVFANLKMEATNESEQYEKNLEIIKEILQSFDVLFPTILKCEDLKEDGIYYRNNPNTNSQPNANELIIFDDSLSNVVEDIYINEDATYNLENSSAFAGYRAIELVTSGRYIQFKPEFWNKPIDVSKYDYLEFRLRPSQHNFHMAVTGEYDNIYSSGLAPSYSDLGRSDDFSSVYTWLGIQTGNSQGWRLIQIPISTLDQDQDGKIYGISFEFFGNFGDIILDDIKFVLKE